MDSITHIRCTYPGCRCQEFKPNSENARKCDLCSHGWVPHALDKIAVIYEWPPGKYEPVTFDSVFDIASLVLYGTQAIPHRLHICLYRLLCALDNQEECIRIASVFGWPWEDFVRGHKLDDGNNGMRNIWNYATLNDETMILGHFLRFKATQSVAYIFLRELTEQKNEDNPYLRYCIRLDTNLKTFFIQQNTLSAGAPNLQLPILQQQNGQLQGIPGPSPVAQLETSVPQLLLRTFPSQNPPAMPSAVNGESASFNGCPSPASDGQMTNGQSDTAGIKLQPMPTHPMLSMEPSSIVFGIPNVSTSQDPPRSESRMRSNSGIRFRVKRPKVSPSKRVPCDKCQKTFYDKGALKIHYSAVHLKEMHKCTLDGCNMMFSSRRSRNRHSSNLNPKLHQNDMTFRRRYVSANDNELPSNSDQVQNVMDIIDVSDSEVEGSDHRSVSYDPENTESSQSQVDEPKLVIADSGSNSPQTIQTEGRKFVPNMSQLISSTMPTMAPPTMLGHFMESRRHSEGFNEGLSVKLVLRKRPLPSQSGRRDSFDDEEPRKEADDDDSFSLKSDPSDGSGSNIQVNGQYDEQGRPVVPFGPMHSNRCVVCHKVFKNHATYRLHFIDVHLRVMHPCTVPGCGSQFPSARSRDRHAKTASLHAGLMGEKELQITRVNPVEIFHDDDNGTKEQVEP